MIVVTGSQGFIGSYLVNELRNQGNIVVGVDFEDEVPVGYFSEWWSNNCKQVEFVYHLGAITNTLETDKEKLDTFNTNFSKVVWYSCFVDKVPLVYASSAATYGFGSFGFSDHHSLIGDLEPVNLYAKSKHEFDMFALSSKQTPPNWYGLKFFNVYGCGEGRKDKMASMIYQGYQQLKKTGSIKIFEGIHMRDFICVEDVVNVMIWFKKALPESGIYNVGTGQAASFNHMAMLLIKSLGMDVSAYQSIPMPEDVSKQYQAYTQADITKLRKAGYINPFTPLSRGIDQFVKTMENEPVNIPVQPS